MNEKNIFNPVQQNCHVHFSNEHSEIKHELEKSSLLNSHYEKEMTYLKEEIAHLKEIIRLMQRSSK